MRDCLTLRLYCKRVKVIMEEEGVTDVGKAYHVKCTECAYEETFYLGIGANDADMVREAIEDLSSGGYGEAALAFAMHYESGLVECQRMLYRCRKCGRLETRIKMRMIGEDMSFSQPYFCTACGKLLGQVKPADVKKQSCPRCGKPIEVVETFRWDIAPKPMK